MAAISTKEKSKIRQKMSSIGTVDYNRPTINAAMQAVEDWFDGERATISAQIDIATSPKVLSNQQKKKLVGFWMLKKYVRELS